MTGRADVVQYIIKSLSSKILHLSVFSPEVTLWSVLPPVQIILGAPEGQTVLELSIQ